jgi:hypothetical protein
MDIEVEDGVRSRGVSSSGSVKRSGECVRESAGVEGELGMRERPRPNELHSVLESGVGISISEVQLENDDVKWVSDCEITLRASRAESTSGMNEPIGCSVHTRNFEPDRL